MASTTRGEKVTSASGTIVRTRTVEVPIQQIQKEYVSTVVEKGPIETRVITREEVVEEDVEVDEPMTVERRDSYAWGVMVLMLFSILISIIVIILLWVVDFQTNQYADTTMLAIQIVLMVVVVVLAYYLQPTEMVEEEVVVNTVENR